MNKFPVLEVFGPTIQGEGMVVGRKTMFVRTAGCDYSCSWCDSAFTWDGSAKDDILLLSADEIIEKLVEAGGANFDHVTISGGNPALLRNLGELIEKMHNREWQVALETQGSRWQDWFAEIDDLTISPKPPSSGMTTNWEVLDAILNRLREKNRHQKASLKVVIFDDDDLKYAETIHHRYPEVSFFLQVGNDDLKEGNAGDLAVMLLKKYEWLVEQVMKSEVLNRVRVLPQVHALLWGNKRGV